MFSHLKNTIAGILIASGLSITYAVGSTLPDAMQKGDVEQLTKLLESGADPNEAQSDGTTAIIWSAYHTNPQAIKLLLEKGAHPTTKNQFGVHAISIACQNGDLESTKLLIDAGADPNGTLEGGETLLHSAARNGNEKLVQYLLDKKAKLDNLADGKQTALMWAASAGNLAAVDTLLKAGADPEAVSKGGIAAMHYAARAGRISVVKRLLKAGVDVDSPINWKGSKRNTFPANKSTPLVLAIENAEFELAVELLKAGANANDMATGYSPLHILAWVRKADTGDSTLPGPVNHSRVSSTDFILALIKHGAKLNARLPRGSSSPGKFSPRGTTPFFSAADRGDLEFMKILVAHGADAKLPNADGTTPLMVAAGVGRGAENDEAGTQEEMIEAVRYCIELGMDVNAVDENGETAMHGAAYGQWPDMVEFLDEQGADINIWNKRNKYKWSPLLIARGYRRGNFKPSYKTAKAIETIMVKKDHSIDVTPPKPKKGYGN